MNLSKINIKQLENILSVMPSSQNIMLVGKHGIGKSEILTHYFADKGIPVVALFLGQMSDPGDLIGLPHLNEETGITEFMPPYWFPVDGKPVVLFLDELNRARPEILQTIMELALNRTLAGHALPEGSRVISAVNDGDEYQLTDLDPALVSRFNIYEFRPSVQEWIRWASQNHLDERVVQFIQSHTDMLDGKYSGDEAAGLTKTPDRRAWKKLSDCIKGQNNMEDLKIMCTGIVGAPATAAFYQFLTSFNQLSAKKILLNYDACQARLARYKLHELSTLNEDIFRFLDMQEWEAEEEATIVANFDQYWRMLRGKKSKEAFAHLVSVFESGNYPRAISLIMGRNVDFYHQIRSFVNEL